MHSLCSLRSLHCLNAAKQSRCFTRISRRPVSWAHLSIVRLTSSSATSENVPQHKDHHQEVAEYQKWLPPGVRQVTIPDNEWDTVLFSVRHTLKALDEFIEKCKEEKKSVDFDALQKLRSYLEARAANEVVMEFEVDEDTYNDIMCKIDPNFVPTVSWETRLLNARGPTMYALYKLRSLLKHMPSTWLEQLAVIAEARDDKFARSFPKIAEMIQETVKRKEEKYQKAKAEAKETTYPFRGVRTGIPDGKDQLFFYQYKQAEKRIFRSRDQTINLDDKFGSILTLIRARLRRYKAARLEHQIASTSKRLEKMTKAKKLGQVHRINADEPRPYFWWFDRTPYLPKDLNWKLLDNDIAAAKSDISRLLKDPTFFTDPERARLSRALSACFDPTTINGEMKIYTRPSFNPPTMYRPSPYTPEEARIIGFDRLRDRFAAILDMDPPQPLTAQEEIIAVKLQRLWTEIYPLATLSERWEFAETFDISPGERTLDWVHSYPPPFHTYEELPILKEPEEDPHWHEH
jgi:hypothetical protein